MNNSMQRKAPKNNDRYLWTQHSIMKMQFYGLSEQKVLGIIRRPKRKEEGIVKNTIAVMQPVSEKVDAKGESTWKTEIWAMYQTKKTRNSKLETTINQNLKFNPPAGGQNSNPQIRIISAWRYPGVSPKNNPIPEEILRELSESVI